MKLRVTYSVKFRAMFITFGTISGVREIGLSMPRVPVPIPPFQFNDRGLAIKVELI